MLPDCVLPRPVPVTPPTALVRLRMVWAVSAAHRPSVHIPPKHADPLRHRSPGMQSWHPEDGGPQSTSCSDPSSSRLSQRGAWQMPSTHCPVHCADDEHDTPGPHSSHRPPPQSPPGASSAWAMPSEQVGAAHTPPEQDLDEQSDPTKHTLPTEHRWQPEVPPQSVPVSPPLRRPSKQVGRSQTPALALQCPESQSRSRAQLASGAQGWHVAPPPSTQVSFPSCLPLLQDGGATHLPPEHSPDSQSSWESHLAPTLHLPQDALGSSLTGPTMPQSTSVSATAFQMPS